MLLATSPVASLKHSRQYRRRLAFVLLVLLTEALLQFLIFQMDHDRSSEQRESGQHIADRQSRTDAPGQHLAKMSKVNRVANVRADARGNQPLLAMARHYFRKAPELCRTEAGSGSHVDPEPCG